MRQRQHRRQETIHRPSISSQMCLGFRLGWLLTRVAAAERMSVQALLREINPRMRKGCRVVRLLRHTGKMVIGSYLGTSCMPCALSGQYAMWCKW